MSWQCLEITVKPDVEQHIGDLLFEAGAVSVTSSAGDDSEIFEAAGQVADNWQQVKLTGMFESSADMDAVAEQIARHIDTSIKLTRLEDRNWRQAWQKNFKQLKINDRLWVCPSWLEPIDPDVINIRIDPGMSFGTGTHQSTRLCLDWISELKLEGQTVIDYGCGSGILAIAAIMLGARQALATDIEFRALAASQENAKNNRVGDALKVFMPDQLPDIQADLVVANILAGTIIDLAEVLTRHTKSNGHLLLSGILLDQQQAVRDSLPEFQWKSRSLDNWVALLGHR